MRSYFVAAAASFFLIPPSRRRGFGGQLKSVGHAGLFEVMPGCMSEGGSGPRRGGSGFCGMYFVGMMTS